MPALVGGSREARALLCRSPRRGCLGPPSRKEWRKRFGGARRRCATTMGRRRVRRGSLRRQTKLTLGRMGPGFLMAVSVQLSCDWSIMVSLPSRDCDCRTSRVRMICCAAPRQIRTKDRAPPDDGMCIGRGDASLRCQKWNSKGRVASMIHC